MQSTACAQIGATLRQPRPPRGRPTARNGGLMASLNGKKIAFLATDGFEQAELLEPRKALDEAGATTIVIAPKDGEIKAWDMKDWGEKVKVDKVLADANPNDYD